MSARYEIPVLAWNDRQTGIQVARTLSKRLVLRVDSLPAKIDKDALRDVMDGFDLTWISYRHLKECLAKLHLRMKIQHEVVDEVLLKATDSMTRFERLVPPARMLLNERKILEKATQKRFDSFEIKEDIKKLEEAGEVFYYIVSIPVEKRYDLRSALRRAESERKLVKDLSNEAAMRRREAELPALIAKNSKAADEFRRRAGKYARLATRADAHAVKLAGELTQISSKIRALGTFSTKNEAPL